MRSVGSGSSGFAAGVTIKRDNKTGATCIRLPVSIIFFAPIRKVDPRRESLGSDRN